jgi:hypothetical protein
MCLRGSPGSQTLLDASPWHIQHRTIKNECSTQRGCLGRRANQRPNEQKNRTWHPLRATETCRQLPGESFEIQAPHFGTETGSAWRGSGPVIERACAAFGRRASDFVRWLVTTRNQPECHDSMMRAAVRIARNCFQRRLLRQFTVSVSFGVVVSSNKPKTIKAMNSNPNAFRSAGRGVGTHTESPARSLLLRMDIRRRGLQPTDYEFKRAYKSRRTQSPVLQ